MGKTENQHLPTNPGAKRPEKKIYIHWLATSAEEGHFAITSNQFGEYDMGCTQEAMTQR